MTFQLPKYLLATMLATAACIGLPSLSQASPTPVAFATPYDLPISQVGTVDVGDIDGDGHQDIVCLTDTGFTVFYGHGDGTFDTVQYAVKGQLSRPVLADVNGDNRLDIIAPNWNGNDVWVFLNLGNRQFNSGASYVADTNPAGLGVGDFNGDGYPDIAVPCNGGHDVVVLMNAGDGSFVNGGSYGGGTYPISAAVGDFNGDGNLDFVETAHYESAARVFIGNGHGQFSYNNNVPVGGGELLVADYDNDGNLDVAVGDYWAGLVGVSLGDGTGKFPAGASYGGEQYPMLPTFGDVNGDGYADLEIPNAGTNHFTVLLNAGDGTFSTQQTFSTLASDTRDIRCADFNEDGQKDLVVANGTNHLTIYLNATLGAPTVASVSPGTIVAGAGATQITLNGTQFSNVAVASLNGTPLSTTFVSRTQITAVVPSTLLTTPGSYSVTVTNPAPGGGTSAPVALTVSYPTSVLTVLNPWVLTIGATPVVTVSCTGFFPGSRAYANTTLVKSTNNNDGTVTLNIPASLTAQTGTIVIRIFNPTPGGGMSNPLDLSVFNPVPGITSLTPSSIPSGSGDTVVTVKGTGLVASSVVSVDGTSLPTTYNGGALSVSVPAASLTKVKNLSFVVTTGAPGGGSSSSFALPVVNPVPTLSALHTTSAPIGSSSFVMYAFGTGFVAGSSQIVFGSLVLPANLTVTGEWYATIPASALTSGGTIPVSLRNLGPGGGTSNAINFSVVSPVPTVTSISPTSSTVGAAFTLVVTGTGFASSSKIKVGALALATTLNNDGTLSATVPATVAGGSYAVSVVTPAPGGGTSNSAALALNNPVPSLISVHAPTIAAGSPSFVLYIQGTGFVPGVSQILFGSLALPASINVTGDWYATVPASAIATPGVTPVSLSNPTPGGGVSSSLPFTVK